MLNNWEWGSEPNILNISFYDPILSRKTRVILIACRIYTSKFEYNQPEKDEATRPSGKRITPSSIEAVASLITSIPNFWALIFLISTRCN